MLNSDQHELVAFIRDAAPTLPVQQRIRVYRGLADFLDTDRELRIIFAEKANVLEQAERRCGELDICFPKPGGVK